MCTLSGIFEEQQVGREWFWTWKHFRGPKVESREFCARVTICYHPTTTTSPLLDTFILDMLEYQLPLFQTAGNTELPNVIGIFCCLEQRQLILQHEAIAAAITKERHSQQQGTSLSLPSSTAQCSSILFSRLIQTDTAIEQRSCPALTLYAYRMEHNRPNLVTHHHHHHHHHSISSTQ